jgi:hypothetical protein
MVRKTYYRIITMIIFLFLLITGCTKTIVNVSLRDVPYPVMVSPIIRIGDNSAPNIKLPEVNKFSGKIEKKIGHYQSGAGLSGQRYDNYSDVIAREISKASADRTDLLASVDRLCVVEWEFWFALNYTFFQEIAVEGKILDPKALQRRIQ